MTVAELGDRLSVPELHDWMEFARVRNDEIENQQRLARVETMAKTARAKVRRR